MKLGRSRRWSGRCQCKVRCDFISALRCLEDKGAVLIGRGSGQTGPNREDRVIRLISLGLGTVAAVSNTQETSSGGMREEREDEDEAEHDRISTGMAWTQ